MSPIPTVAYLLVGTPLEGVASVPTYKTPALAPPVPAVLTTILLTLNQVLPFNSTPVCPFKLTVSTFSSKLLSSPLTVTVLAPVPAAVSLAEELDI